MNIFDEEEDAPHHDISLICLNGHVVNDSFRTYPQFNSKHCERCGEPTINACPGCNKSIKGDYKVPGIVIIGAGGEKTAPSFCENCGKSFPWTERRIVAAKELAEVFDILTADEKLKLQGTLDDLVREGPRTEPAKLRFKQIMKKVGGESYDMMKTVVTDLVSESVRKSIFGA